MTARHFRDLQAWQSARRLAKLVYETSDQATWQRDFALRDQIRRAAISVMNNVAEGFARGGDADFLRFLDYARGSLAEVQSCLILAEDLGRTCLPETAAEADQCARMIAGLAGYLRQTRANEPGVPYSV
jgi:four helix bundle protein